MSRRDDERPEKCIKRMSHSKSGEKIVVVMRGDGEWEKEREGSLLLLAMFTWEGRS